MPEKACCAFLERGLSAYLGNEAVNVWIPKVSMWPSGLAVPWETRKMDRAGPPRPIT